VFCLRKQLDNKVMLVVRLFIAFFVCLLPGLRAQENVRGMTAGTPKSRSLSGACSTPSGSGACVSTSDCSAGGGTSYAGYCPGAADIQCCVGGKSCNTPQGSGTCIDSSICNGMAVSGYCPGSASIQCCVNGGGGGGSYGVDISQPMSTSTGNCLVSQGFGKFIAPRGYQSIGQVDTAVCTSLQSAASAGFKVRDVYIFPSPTSSKSARTQMTELVNYVSSNCKSAWSGRVWLDIEGAQYWKGDSTLNRQFYEQLYDSCAALGVSCGVYSSASQWSAIFGSTSYCHGSQSPLWYAHYDGNPSFSDYATFGCWANPWAKQFKGDATVCGMGVDENYVPNI